MKCVKSGCDNTAVEGRTFCEECLKPYYSDNGTLIYPPNISEETYESMCEFFSKARYKRLRKQNNNK